MRCTNCGRPIFKEEDCYPFAFGTAGRFCCEACYDEYKQRHPGRVRCGCIIQLIILLGFLIGILVAVVMKN